MSDLFSVVYADPPWRYSNRPPESTIERHYPTMSDAEICALSFPIAADAALYLWATAPRLDSALAVVAAWGVTYKSCLVWDKGRLGLGYWVRVQHEILLIAARGKMRPPVPALRRRSVFRHPAGRHSAKPDHVREWIEGWHPNARRLEVFSRLARPGWEHFGNQIETDLFSPKS